MRVVIMIVIVSGINRVEFCHVKKKKDFDRRFFMTRGQLYFVPVNGLTRIRIREFGKDRDSDAAIIYEENKIVPYDIRDNLDFNMDNMLADIDRYKEMTDYSWFKTNKPYIVQNASKLWQMMTSGGGIVVLVLLWVFLTGGGK